MKYLYVFGFNTPEQFINNRREGWDDEDSIALFVEAASEKEALAWGQELSERYVKYLFQQENWKEEIPNWKDDQFANWIEKEPLKRFSGLALETLPVVKYSVVPDMEELNKGRYEGSRFTT